jgi:hypothetical protein
VIGLLRRHRCARLSREESRARAGGRRPRRPRCSSRCDPRKVETALIGKILRSYPIGQASGGSRIPPTAPMPSAFSPAISPPLQDGRGRHKPCGRARPRAAPRSLGPSRGRSPAQPASEGPDRPQAEPRTGDRNATHPQPGEHPSNTQENVSSCSGSTATFRRSKRPRPTSSLAPGSAIASRPSTCSAAAATIANTSKPLSALAELVPPGKASTAVLSKEGTGRLYYRVGMQYALSDLRPPPAEHGFSVARVYEGRRLSERRSARSRRHLAHARRLAGAGSADDGRPGAPLSRGASLCTTRRRSDAAPATV